MRLEYIQDTVGNNYLGIPIYNDLVRPFLDKLKDIVGDEYDLYTSAQQLRDHNKYHITVMPVFEYNQLCNKYSDKFINDLDQYFNFDFDDVKLMGLGRATRAGNTAYFIVVKSEKLQLLRKRYDLEEKDFHITLGFKYKDVHGVPKNEIITDTNNFLTKIEKEYYQNNESFDFIKTFDNYTYDPQFRISVVKMYDTYFVFKVGENDYISVSDIGDKLTISGKWQDTNKLPIISNTLITRKFKK